MSVFILACGGTGGHLTPGIAIAEALVARGHRCLLVVSEKKVDARLLEKYPHLSFVCAPGVAFSLKPFGFVRFLWQFAKSFLFFKKLLKKVRPDLLMGFGGFISAGLLASSFFSGRPRVLHEANRVPGRVTRLFAPFLQRLYLPDGITLRGVDAASVRYLGYPVRKEMVKIPQAEARKRIGFPENGPLVLVFGGSQGAHVFNEWVFQNMEKFLEHRINVFCITGLRDAARAGSFSKKHSDETTTQVTFSPFRDDMEVVMSAADLAVARAGAGTVAEFTAMALPMVLLPYPHAANDHQTANARFVEQQGSGIVLSDEKLPQLFEEVNFLIKNPTLLEKFRQNLARFHRPETTSAIAEDLDEMSACSRDRQLSNISSFS